MRAIDKLSLIDRIGRELQSRMGYHDIDVYLSAHGVDIDKPTSGINSKWVYTKDLLADVSEHTIINIADELNIPHDYASTATSETIEATFWDPLHFRLFLSHLSSFKREVGSLQTALKRYGISAFVAHVDIEPTKEWQDEIEAGLLTMDALAAILIPGFPDSKWTDQEVGAALGRGILIIPVITGMNPYGFIAKYQGMNAKGKKVSQVAQEIFEILASSPKTRAKMLTALVDTALQSSNEDEALDKVRILDSVKDLPPVYLERLRDAASTSPVFASGTALDYLNGFLLRKGLNKVETDDSEPISLDDIPF